MLQELLAAEPWRREIDWPTGFEGGIAHRLDTWTSGALLVADSLDELAEIRALFTERAFVKTYRFRSIRDATWREERCTRALAHHQKNKRKMVAQRGPLSAKRGEWFPAETRFRRLGPCLFEARMRTGVMHQIRVHAAELGIPIEGDRLYGGGRPAAIAPEAAAAPANDSPTHAPIPESAGFLLHHVGLKIVQPVEPVSGDDGPDAMEDSRLRYETEAVPLPDWAMSQVEARAALTSE